MPELVADLAPQDDDERLDQAEGVVRDFCGWHIAPERTETVKFYGHATNAPILLPTMYLTGIASVTDQGTLLDPSVYDFDPAGLLLRIDGGCWATGYGPLVVEFTHGYNETPPGVARAVQAVAGALSTGALKSKQAGPFAESYLTDISTLDRATLSRYRIPVGP